MKTWILVAIVAGLFVLGGVAIVQAHNSQVTDQETTQTAPTGTYSCAGYGSGSCNGGCTAENNCGMAECGAVSGTAGTGSCGCGR